MGKAVQPIAVNIKTAAKMIGIGETKMRELLNNRAMPARKLGSRTLIRTQDLERFYEELPDYEPEIAK